MLNQLLVNHGHLLMWSDLTLSPSLKVKRGQPNLKVLITRLLLIPGLRCETNLKDIMGWESSDVVRFDIWPLFQGQTRVHSGIQTALK